MSGVRASSRKVEVDTSKIKAFMDILQQLKVPYVDMEDCQSHLDYEFKNSSILLCADGNNDEDSYQGDSGSPLVYIEKTDRSWFQLPSGHRQCWNA